MAAAKARTWKTWAVLALVYVLAFFVFARETWIVEQMQAEQAMVRAAWGEARAEAALARASRWYERTFVATGVQAESFRMLVPTQAERAAVPGPDAGAPMWAFVEQRLRVLWTLVYQALQRLAVALLFAPPALLIAAAFIVDGLAVPRIRQTGFDYASPARHRYSILALDAALILFALALFLPLAIPPWVAPAFFVGCAAATGMLLANVQKRV